MKPTDKKVPDQMPELDAAHKRVELETDLIGTYYLAEDEPPTAQFGYDNGLPDH